MDNNTVLNLTSIKEKSENIDFMLAPLLFDTFLNY